MALFHRCLPLLFMVVISSGTVDAVCTEDYSPCSCDDSGTSWQINCSDVRISEIRQVFERTSRVNLGSLDVTFTPYDSGVAIPRDFLSDKVFDGYLGLHCPATNYMLKINSSAFGVNSFKTVEIDGCSLYQQPDLGFLANLNQLEQLIIQRCSYFRSYTGIPSSVGLINIYASNTFDQLDDSRVELPLLKTLWIENNFLTDQSAQKTLIALAGGSDSLDELRLDGNRLTVVPPAVQRLTSLKTLYISGNAIRNVQTGTLAFPPTSEVVVIADVNLIERIDPDTFGDGIKSLGLTNNRLLKFESSVFKALLENFERRNWGPVAVAGNDFDCDCHLKWLIRDNRQLMPYVKEAKCANSTAFQDLNPESYGGCPVDEFKCPYDGNFEACNCCDYYYSCSGGYAYIIYCPDNLVFNQALNECANPVGCNV